MVWRIRMTQRSIRSANERSAPLKTSKLGLPALASLGGERRNGHRHEDEAECKWVREALSRTEEALETSREREELHRLFFEKVPHPRFVCDAKTLGILVVNEAAIQRYGYSRAQFLSMKMTDLVVPE